MQGNRGASSAPGDARHPTLEVGQYVRLQGRLREEVVEAAGVADELRAPVAGGSQDRLVALLRYDLVAGAPEHQHGQRKGLEAGRQGVHGAEDLHHVADRGLAAAHQGVGLPGAQGLGIAYDEARAEDLADRQLGEAPRQGAEDRDLARRGLRLWRELVGAREADEPRPQVAVAGRRPSGDEAADALPQEEARLDPCVRRALCVDAPVVRDDVRGEGLHVVEVHGLAIAETPASHVCGEDGDALGDEPLRELLIHPRVVHGAVHDHQRGPSLGRLLGLPTPSEEPEAVVARALEGAGAWGASGDRGHGRRRLAVLRGPVRRHAEARHHVEAAGHARYTHRGLWRGTAGRRRGGGRHG
mmetsp:Transcript_79518/g.223037  ORF Transcript_79518/g.223037 Transcript_79518/m.223037 type:complete len:357 (+) Transcript_79518:181-1251(+)